MLTTRPRGGTTGTVTLVTWFISLTDPSYGNCTYEGGETAVDVASGCSKPLGSDDQLQANIDFCCGKVDCSIVKSGGACFDPKHCQESRLGCHESLLSEKGEADMSCDFNGTGNIVTNDPSYGDCKFKIK
ncbi:hypothetical protein M0R45_013556 [Rubus argutus]|uniref:X8 domain-containing protein n=1 Tax=Rubus argutus TaxID=59490 RepID=A0AAW1XIV0_RUBAR